MTRHPAGACAALCLALVGPLSSRPARADTEQRVLLVAPPPRLEPAVRTALSPWPIRIVVTADAATATDTSAPVDRVRAGGAAPGATMPGSAERARALAAEHRAGAVVWLSDDGEGGRALWIYDSASDRTTARRLTRPPPFDDPSAAAVALTIKTLLRHSSVVPALERFGAEAARAETAGRAARLRADSMAGLRIRRTGAGDVEPRLGAGIRAAPGRLADFGAIAASLEVGPGVSVDDADFTGQFSDLQVSAAFLVRLPLGRRLHVWPRLGGSLHVTEIDGAIAGRPGRVRAGRVNPAVDAGASLELALRPWLSASIAAAASYGLRRQIYLVGGESVLTVPRVEVEIGVALSVSLL